MCTVARIKVKGISVFLKGQFTQAIPALHVQSAPQGIIPEHFNIAKDRAQGQHQKEECALGVLVFDLRIPQALPWADQSSPQKDTTNLVFLLVSYMHGQTSTFLKLSNWYRARKGHEPTTLPSMHCPSLLAAAVQSMVDQFQLYHPLAHSGSMRRC